ncbi:MAG: hypothetical protein J6T10_20150 [Methanobrevibacter sp.]|nr:hypothetical protein [Methanobrevibacter sp.]
MLGGALSGIGAGMSALGGSLETIGNMKSKNKARKARIAGLNDAKNEFTLGSTDTQGNRINFNKDRGWGFDLSNSGKAEVTNANRQSYLANAMSAKLPSAYRNQLTAQDYLSAQRQANANQNAASRVALRTGSNVGDVMRSFGRAGSDYLRQAMLQNIRNGQAAQAQNIANYINNAASAKAITQGTMQNLLNMQEGPAAQQLALNQAIAEAKAVPTTNWLQTGGKILQGTGQAVGGFGNNMNMLQQLQGINAQNQQRWNDYMKLLQQYLNK